MRIAVVIPVLAGVTEDYAKVCIKSLRATTDWTIIVVTNGSKIKPDLSGIGATTHIHTRDRGQCNAVNIGMQLVSTADYALVSNDDMYYAPGWNERLRFEYPVFSPNLIEPVNNHGSAPPFLKLDAGFTLDEFDPVKVEEFIKGHEEADHLEDGLEETGFNLPFFIRPEIFRKIGGYDIAYDPLGSNSDTDIQTKINLYGITPMRLRDVLVYHFSNKSGTFEPENQLFWQNNWEYFDSKFGFNRDTLGSDVWYNKNMLPEDKAQIKYKPEWAGKYEA